jgi:hypothetical protein
MSDLQDLIVSNGINAWNNGYRDGIVAERNRILEIAHKITFENWKGHDLISLQDLVEYVNETK